MLDDMSAGLQSWLTVGLVAAATVAGVLVVYWFLLKAMRRLTRRTTVARTFADASGRALGVVVALIALRAVLQGAPPELPLLGVAQHLTTLALIVGLTWSAVRFTASIGEVIVALNPAVDTESRRARAVQTQTHFLTRGLNILIVIVGLALALMTLPPVQQIGTSLLASAGIGGIILGFAARPVLTNLLAGMQIALTQPFRLDDVLRVQGEWCWVEEVTSTYVVLRVWDLRRLVVPLQWFIENPFENWTRNSNELMGPVFLWVDYRMPVDPMREEFLRLLGEAPEWDGKTGTIQVTDAGDRAMQVRFLMSARDSSQLWDLRCRIREGLVAYVQREHPEHLPVFRARLTDSADGHDPLFGARGGRARS